MQCVRCGAVNPADHRFCSECGSALVAACPACGHANPPTHRFCSDCGAALGEGPPAAEGSAVAAAERRFVSVLFADLAGFTSFSESRDSEEVRAVVTRYYERATDIVERFGGRVDKFIGDAVMAVWGAVEAHEDDAERAVRAGLELVDMVTDLAARIGVSELNVRAGILTGATSVGPGGNEERLLVGDLVNTASRLEALAPPGTVLVGEPTYLLVKEGIAFEPFGTHEVKGKAEPVTAYTALRVVAETGGRGRDAGLEAPFVGRADELRLLKDQLHAAGRDRNSRLVSIVGEAGIGKSRLVWELQKYVDGLAEAIYWHQGRSPSYGDGVTFWALGEMVRERAGIAETDDAGKARMRLRTAVAEYVSDVDDQRWVEPRLAGLLGLDEMPAGDRSELFSALRTFFQRVSERGTTVLVFENLHWADGGLVEFVEDLVDRSTSNPLLVVTVARPDLLERRPGWGSGRRNSLSLQLGPLPDGDMEALVAGMAAGTTAETAVLIARRAAGVPLYAVEFVRMLINEGALVAVNGGFHLVGDLSELGIPDSLHAVVGARLDRLQSADRALIQDAAVLGYSFTAATLAAIRGETQATTAERLNTLARRELLQLVDDPRSPGRGQYRFVQSLIREVAYSRLSREERRQRHLQVADLYRSLEDSEVAGIIASHYLDALEASLTEADAASVSVLARHALEEAAERARNLHSYEQASGLYRRALELTDDPKARAELLTESARSVDALGDVDEAVTQLREAMALFTAVGDEDGRLGAVTRLGELFSNNFQADEAVAILEPEYRHVGELNDRLRIRLATEMSRALMLAGRDEKAAEVADKALAAAEREEWTPIILSGLINRGTALANMGRFREGSALLTGAVELADQTDHLWHQGRALNNLASTLALVNPMAADETGLQVLAVVKRLGHPAWTYRAGTDVASSHIDCGEYDRAAAMLDDLDTGDVPDPWGILIDGLRGRIDMARTGAEAGVDRWRGFLDHWGKLPDTQARYFSQALLAQAHIAAGNPEAGYEDAMAVEELFAEVYPLHLQVAVEAAAALRDSMRASRVAEDLGSVTGPGAFLEGLRLYAAAGVLALGGNTEEGAVAFTDALRRWESVARPVDVNTMRVNFARLVGLEHPQAAAAARAAQRWVDETGSYGLARLWADGLPPHETVPAVGE